MAVRRAIELKGLNKTLEISKVTQINNDGFKSIHIDELPDGTYRIIYGSSVIDEISKLESLNIIRED